MRFRALFLIAAINVGAAMAAPTTYNVLVNTSSLSGKTGSLDFNFNPGPLTSQSASVQILSFTGGAVTGGATLAGDASGALPGAITFDNGTPFNDYFQDFTFGSSLSFTISLYGPALSSPNGTATSGSSFAFSIFSDSAGTIPALTTDKTNGFAYLVNVNLDGSTTATSFLQSTTPEPSSLMLAGAALILAAVSRFRRRKSASA